MKKSAIFLGILFIVLAIVGLGIFFVIPSLIPSIDQAPSLKNFLQPILCQSGERLTSTQLITHDADGNGYSVSFSCVDREGQHHNADAKALVIGVVVFLIPLLVGIALILVGSRWRKSVKTTGYSQGFYMAGQSGMGGESSSTARLNNLKSAFDAGLITEAEYEAKRQEILGKM